MARTWLSIRVDLVAGRGKDLWPRPGRIFAASRTHTFKQLADAIDDAFARWDRAHLCTVGRERIDPVGALGILPDNPLPYWGWGDIPDQYRRRWDLWFCAVAVADHGASLDQLEELLIAGLAERNSSREGTESKLSHLADLRVCLVRRSRVGHWDAFPVNPEVYYRSFRRNVEVKGFISESRSFGAVRRILGRLESLDKAGLGVRERLALYRAFHTAGLELADRADDSCGNVGDMRRDAWHSYLDIDWQATGMLPESYWADLCDLVVFENYGLGFREETLPWSHVPAGQADLVEGLLLALEAECRAFHLDYRSY